MLKRCSAALALAAAAAAIAAPEAPSDAGSTRGGGLKPFEGTVVAVDRKAARVSVAGPSGTFPVAYDRDTAVYLEDRTGTPLDVVAGKRVRGATDAANRAYWIAVLPPQPAPDAGSAAETAPSSAPADAGPSPGAPAAGGSSTSESPPPPVPRPAPPPPVGPGGIGPGGPLPAPR